MTMLDDHDQATADELARGFSRITLDRPAPSARTRHRSRHWLAAAATVIAVSAAGAITLWPSRTNDVYAGWTPVPRAAQPGEIDGVLDACNGRTPDASVLAPANAFGPDAHTEFRGKVGLTLTTIDGSVLYCTARQTDDGWYAFGLGARPVSDTEPVLQGGGGDDAMTWLVHGANSAAARVDLLVPWYPTISATVIDGVYFAWWPDQDRKPEVGDLPELQVDIYNTDDELIDTITW